MTVKETIEMYKGRYDFVEIFVGEKFHTDFCDSYDPEKGFGDCPAGQESRLNSYCLDYNVEKEDLMSCDEYNNSILANCGTTTADYGYEGTEKILCLLISRKSIAEGEEFGL